MRLIDGDALLRNIRRAMYPSDMTTTIAVGICESHVKDMPTIDAVPVVRCNECKCWHRDDPVGKACKCYLNGGWWLPEDYCSCGERREADADTP